MTLQEVLDMTPEQFSAACEAARVDYSHYESINADTETFAQALDGFVKFKLTPESIKAVYEAGNKIP
jgi:hypothetical protein